MDLIISLLVNAVAIFIIGYVLKGVQLKGFGAALWVAIVLALINTFVRPIVAFLAIPVTFLTLGLFVFVINALMLMLVDKLVDGLKIENFWWALLFGLLLSLLNLGFF